ncbi:basic 7S globulin-like [Hibiscus syriacus]|uniref:Basic 7S globulin-like n=1 Tax=Hibiscus syriacus TaxID=106335 RepID=A0A6A3CUL9_HIBSY|nr:basic 7S globulin-like [Hibiscus syriacus]
MGVQQVLSKFRQIPEMKQSKKVNQESFLIQRITKANEQLKKQCRINREKEMTYVMFQNLMGKADIDDLNMMDLNDLGVIRCCNTISDARSNAEYECWGQRAKGCEKLGFVQGQHWTMELMNDNPQVMWDLVAIKWSSHLGITLTSTKMHFPMIICLVLSWRGLR